RFRIIVCAEAAAVLAIHEMFLKHAERLIEGRPELLVVVSRGVVHNRPEELALLPQALGRLHGSTAVIANRVNASAFGIIGRLHAPAQQALAISLEVASGEALLDRLAPKEGPLELMPQVGAPAVARCRATAATLAGSGCIEFQDIGRKRL